MPRCERRCAESMVVSVAGAVVSARELSTTYELSRGDLDRQGGTSRPEQVQPIAVTRHRPREQLLSARP